MCTSSHETATVTTATAVISTCVSPSWVEAFSNVRPTPSRLAMQAAIRTTSAAAREPSSRVAMRRVVSASAPCTAAHTHTQNASDMATQASNVATCHGTRNAAITPTTTPTAAHHKTRTSAVARLLLRSLPSRPSVTPRR